MNVVFVEQKVIDGFKIQMTSDELVAHLEKQVAAHLAQAEKLEVVRDDLRAQVDAESMGANVRRTNDAAQIHRRKARAYSVFMERIIPDAMYYLDQGDMIMLGLIENWY